MCLLCASMDTGCPIWASHVYWCLCYASWDTRYLICSSHGSGCLFYAQKARGIYCVPHRTGVSILCLLGHRVWYVPHMAVGVYSVLNRAGIYIVWSSWQRCLFCASWDTGYPISASNACWCLFGASWDTGYLICASQSSACLFCAQLGSGVYCVSPGTQADPIRFAKSSGGLLVVWEDRRSLICAQESRGFYWVSHRAGVSIVCLTGQVCLFCASWDTGYLMCASHDTGVYSLPPGKQGI